MEHAIDFLVENPEQLSKVALKIIESSPERRIVALEGDLGAGKTTLVQVFCKLLGVKEAVHSPTFSIVNEYQYLDKESHSHIIYHIDLYRLKNVDEALDIGLPEYIDCGEWCFIEWPELAEGLLPDDVIRLRISLEPDGRRKILSL